MTKKITWIILLQDLSNTATAKQWSRLHPGIPCMKDSSSVSVPLSRTGHNQYHAAGVSDRARLCINSAVVATRHHWVRNINQ